MIPIQTYKPVDASLLGLTERNLQTIYSILQQFPSIKETVLFGSRAVDNYKPGSDIDLCIMNIDFDKNQLPAVQTAFEDSDLPYFADVLFLHSLQNEVLKAQIVENGKAIYLQPVTSI